MPLTGSNHIGVTVKHTSNGPTVLLGAHGEDAALSDRSQNRSIESLGPSQADKTLHMSP